MTRIIAGVARGRRLRVPAGPGTRPTSDRAREGLFSTLQSLVDVDGARVLDLFAGTGALGLEALSRGAASVTLVEDDPSTVSALRANVELVGLPGVSVVADSAERYLSAPTAGGYDLALVDPPYDDDVAPVLELLLPWLSEGAVVAVERRSRDRALGWPDGYRPERSRRYGEATLWYAVRS